ncbi:MAG: hypothetical protein IPO90_13145 [Flavobacteriales bacterium]|nr:hypothetical protein [Flavobacteriales bacterium]
MDRFNGTGGLTTWHGSGYRTFNISNCDGTRGYAMLLRPDGRLLLAGRCDEGLAFSALAVVALQTTGNNDNTFGTNAQYVVQLSASSEIVHLVRMPAAASCWPTPPRKAAWLCGLVRAAC